MSDESEYQKGYEEGHAEGYADGKSEARDEVKRSYYDALTTLRLELNRLELRFHSDSDAKVQGFLDGYRQALKDVKEAS